MLIPVVLISVINIFIVLKLSGLNFFQFSLSDICRKTPNSSGRQSSNKSGHRSSSQTQRILFTKSYNESNKQMCLETCIISKKGMNRTESLKYTPEDTRSTIKTARNYSNAFTSKSHMNITEILDRKNIKKRLRCYSRTTVILLSISSTYLILFVFKKIS